MIVPSVRKCIYIKTYRTLTVLNKELHYLCSFIDNFLCKSYLLIFIRAVRAMNEALKQNRLSKEQCDDSSSPSSPNDRAEGPHLQKSVRKYLYKIKLIDTSITKDILAMIAFNYRI